MYTIGQVAEMFGITISTLRYYDKEGFFPNMKRKGSIRYFGEEELEAIRIIQCLKKTNLEIKEIKEFIKWLGEGSESYCKRKQMFEDRKDYIEKEIADLQITLSLLKYKCWYYGVAIEDGNEERLKAMLPDKLPADIQSLYDEWMEHANHF